MTATTSKLGADMLKDLEEIRSTLKNASCMSDYGDAVEMLSDLIDTLASQPAAIDKREAMEHTVAGGWKLAMRVLQSDLYSQLDDAERAECDALVRTNPYIAAPLANEASKPAPSDEQDERRRFSSADEFDKWAAASEERADQGERAAFVKLMGYDLPTVDGAAKDVWEGQRATWLEALEFAASTSANVTQGAKLSVWYGSMPESNGKTDWTAILHKGDIAEGITIDRSEYPDRVRYEADRMRWMIGEIDKEPWILDYDADKHSGYAAPPAQTALTDDARECLMDVVSHHHDFRTACIEIKAANETTRSDELYWQKQIDVLDRMKAQAERALTAAQSASGDTK